MKTTPKPLFAAGVRGDDLYTPDPDLFNTIHRRGETYTPDPVLYADIRSRTHSPTTPLQQVAMNLHEIRTRKAFVPKYLKTITLTSTIHADGQPRAASQALSVASPPSPTTLPMPDVTMPTCLVSMSSLDRRKLQLMLWQMDRPGIEWNDERISELNATILLADLKSYVAFF